jgi:hypothetical protein
VLKPQQVNLIWAGHGYIEQGNINTEDNNFEIETLKNGLKVLEKHFFQ